MVKEEIWRELESEVGKGRDQANLRDKRPGEEMGDGQKD